MRSLRFRITALATALVAVTLIMASAAILTLVRADLLATAEEALAVALEEQLIELEAAYSDAAFDAVDDPFSSEVVGFPGFEIGGDEAFLGGFYQDDDGFAYSDVVLGEEVVALMMLDPESGEVIAFIDPETGEFLDDDDELGEAVADLQFGVVVPELYIDDAETLLAERGEPLVVGATSLDDIERSVDALEDALLRIVPLLLLAFALLAWWLVGRALQPVVNITAQVEEISSASLDQRVPVPETGDEVAELALVMNRMLGRLQHGDERQRQFSADASHELRSPLATLRAAAELIERHADPDRARRLAGDIVSETDRMDALIADMLDLARLEEGQVDPDLEPVDLGELAEAEAARAQLDGRASVKVLVNQNPQAVPGSSRQLRRLIANLVDNACRHAHSKVVITVGADADRGVVLTVEDDGPGVPADHVDEIFERFGRLSEARDRDSGGTGLGLSLAKAIAERHGGDIAVSRSPLGGASFTVHFPA